MVIAQLKQINLLLYGEHIEIAYAFRWTVRIKTYMR